MPWIEIIHKTGQLVDVASHRYHLIMLDRYSSNTKQNKKLMNNKWTGNLGFPQWKIKQ
jgi:hypothetical protein